MIQREWDRRIRRANELTSTYPFAAEGLRFYSRVATFQKSLHADLQKALGDSPKISSARPLRDELDLFLLLPNFSRFLSLIEQIAPAPLAQAAAGLARKGTPGWQHAIEDFWHGDLETPMAAGGMTAEWEGDAGEMSPAEQRRRREEISDLHVVRARVGISASVLSGVRRRARAADGVLFGAGNCACARGRLRHVPHVLEEH